MASSSTRWLRRMQRALFGGWASMLATALLLALAAYVLPRLFDWAIAQAVFVPDAQACRAARGIGACWGAIAEKYRAILFGRYPFESQWRPLAATLLLLLMLAASALRVFWTRWLWLAWLTVIAIFFGLMAGGFAGLEPVDTDRWGGLPLTLLLTCLSMAMAFPLAILVALGRRSSMPAISTLCTVYVELVRGVPLISVLFTASFLFPLFLPPGWNVDVLLRVVVAITLFAAAYLAEVIRGGLQAIPRGQIEAADSLGLSYWRTQRSIVLPQALTHVVPAIVNSLIGTFKDTSLVYIVSLYELTGALGLALSGDAEWRSYHLEGYLFIAMIYFIGCLAMSQYSQRLERRLTRERSQR